MYASVDRFGRVNRRISKEDNTGIVVSSSRYDAKKTACSHADIAYIDKYVGKSKETVDAVIKGVLNLQTAPLALTVQSIGLVDLTNTFVWSLGSKAQT